MEPFGASLFSGQALKYGCRYNVAATKYHLPRDTDHIHQYSGSQTSAHVPKDNPAHNGSTGGKRRSHYLILSEPAFELRFVAGLPET
jgi:hypothetical protein